MSVLLNTSAGDIVIDLFVDDCPLATKSFLKLCKLKYYNGCLFYNVQANLLAQTGDPTGTGKGGISAYGLLYGEQAASFNDELVKTRKLSKVGMVCMAHYGGNPNTNRSQFFITLRGEDLEHIEKTHTIFGEVAEGLEVLQELNGLYCDGDHRPYTDVRIKHTYILDDPFPDPAQLVEPPSPEREIPQDELVKARIPFDEKKVAMDEATEAELDQKIKRQEAHSRAIVLEMTGDIPDADVKPPVEVLFVCKLNAVTTDEDLELIFSRFGTIKSCEVIRDFKTGDSLNFAFIEFETEAACIEAYEKMNNVLIDDRRIKVDFSQSVSKLWNKFTTQPRNANAPGVGVSGGAGGGNGKRLGALLKPSIDDHKRPGATASHYVNNHSSRDSSNRDVRNSSNAPSHYSSRREESDRGGDRPSHKSSTHKDDRHLHRERSEDVVGTQGHRKRSRSPDGRTDYRTSSRNDSDRDGGSDSHTASRSGADDRRLHSSDGRGRRDRSRSREQRRERGDSRDRGHGSKHRDDRGR